MEKNGFILYCSHYPTINKLSNEDKGKLLDAIFQFHIERIEPAFDSFPVELAFSFLKQQFERDQDKYMKIVERNRQNGLKGGRPKIDEEPKKPSGLIGLPVEPKKPDKDKDNDKEKNNDKENIEIPPNPKGKNNYLETFILSIPKDWIPVIEKWLEFKKEKNQPYKGLTSLTTMFEKLKKYSNDNPVVGAEIIENSISNNYSGFFKSKDKTEHSMILHQSNKPVMNF